MPRINTINAQGQPAVLNLPRPGPQQFGGPGFSAIAGFGTQFGQTMVLIDKNVRDQQDQLQAVTVAGQYDQEMLTVREDILRDPKAILPGGDYRQQLVNASIAIRDKLFTDNAVSTGVKNAILRHENRELERHTIELQVEGYKRIIGKERADFYRESDRLIDLSVTALDAMQAQEYRSQERALSDGMLSRGLITADEHLKQDESARNRYWEGIATTTPDRMIGIFASGEVPADMDRQKLGHYMNLAIGTVTAQQFRAERIQKQEEAAIKAVQDANARQLTADVLERKPTALANVPALLRNRFITDDTARTLNSLERTLSKEPRTDKLVPGFAAQLETNLRRMKYSTEVLPTGSDQVLLQAFLNDQITKEEFTHLMSLYGSVQDYKSQAGKEDVNQGISRAHTNLIRGLRTTGPADRFDAVSEQTIEAAEEFFYRHPDLETDPWKVKQEAERIFGPVLEKRFNISKTDQVALDDAKMQALARSGAISPAALQAWRNRREEQKGWQIVEETLRNLPPPQEPGFFERFNPFGGSPAPAEPQPGVKPRKRPGMFGE